MIERCAVTEDLNEYEIKQDSFDASDNKDLVDGIFKESMSDYTVDAFISCSDEWRELASHNLSSADPTRLAISAAKLIIAMRKEVENLVEEKF